MTDLPTPLAAPPTAADLDPTVDPTRVAGAVIQTVQAHPDVPPHRAASIIANILASLSQAEPAIFAVSRSSARTQAGVALGVGLAEAIVGAFLQRG